MEYDKNFQSKMIDLTRFEKSAIFSQFKNLYNRVRPINDLYFTDFLNKYTPAFNDDLSKFLAKKLHIIFPPVGFWETLYYRWFKSFENDELEFKTELFFYLNFKSSHAYKEFQKDTQFYRTIYNMGDVNAQTNVSRIGELYVWSTHYTHSFEAFNSWITNAQSKMDIKK
jgi:hypothetical protein